MRFTNTLILLAALVSAAAVPLFIGHGLSSRHLDWIGYGLAAAAAAVALMALHVRALGKRRG